MDTSIKEISENFSKGKFNAVYPHFAEEIQWTMVGAPAVKGKENVIAYCDKLLVEMAGSSLTTTSYIIGDTAIVVEGYCDYTNQDNIAGKIEFCDIYRFKDDKLQEITSYCIECKAN